MRNDQYDAESHLQHGLKGPPKKRRVVKTTSAISLVLGGVCLGYFIAIHQMAGLHRSGGLPDDGMGLFPPSAKKKVFAAGDIPHQRRRPPHDVPILGRDGHGLPPALVEGGEAQGPGWLYPGGAAIELDNGEEKEREEGEQGSDLEEEGNERSDKEDEESETDEAEFSLEDEEGEEKEEEMDEAIFEHEETMAGSSTGVLHPDSQEGALHFGVSKRFQVHDIPHVKEQAENGGSLRHHSEGEGQHHKETLQEMIMRKKRESLGIVVEKVKQNHHLVVVDHQKKQAHPASEVSSSKKHLEKSHSIVNDDKEEMEGLEETWIIQSYNHTGTVKLYSAANDSWRSSVPLEDPPVERFPDYTLLLQTSVERAPLLAEHCERWPGPLAVVLYTTGPAADVPVAAHMPEDCRRRANVVVYQGGPDDDYPVNRLRNLALQEARTSHAFTCDVDFLPDAALYRRLRGLGARSPAELGRPRYALVIAAFSYAEGDSRCRAAGPACEALVARVPRTRAGLRRCFQARECHVFDRHNPEGHSTTGYREWHRQPPDHMRRIACFRSNRYEPYFVVRKHAGLPLYDERFVGYGKNKIQYVAHLRYMGWEFFVVPLSYIIHTPHPKSDSKKDWKRGDHRKQMDVLYRRFLKSIEPMSKTDMVTHKCSTSKK